MALNIENTSGAPLSINDLGIELAIGQIVDLSLSEDPFVIANSANGGDLEALITAPSISVKDPIDGTTALSVADGLAAVRSINETHWRMPPAARLGDISDVDAGGLADNFVLQYNNATSNYEVVSVDTILASGDHGALTGLLDDDHTQYLLIDGTRAMTGDLDMQDNNVRFDTGDAGGTDATIGATSDGITLDSDVQFTIDAPSLRLLAQGADEGTFLRVGSDGIIGYWAPDTPEQEQCDTDTTDRTTGAPITYVATGLSLSASFDSDNGAVEYTLLCDTTVSTSINLRLLVNAVEVDVHTYPVFGNTEIEGSFPIDTFTITSGQTVEIEFRENSGSTSATMLNATRTAEMCVKSQQDAADGTQICDADGDTCVKTEESADEDVIRFDVGDTPSGFGAVENIITLSAADLTIDMGTATTAAQTGATINVTAGQGGATGTGGELMLQGGHGGATSGDGGNVVIMAGDRAGGTGDGGTVTLQGGVGDGPGPFGGYVRIPNVGGTNAIVMDYDSATSAPEFRQEGAGATWIFESEKTFVQFIGGSDAAGTTVWYIDCDNNGLMHFNAFHSGRVRIGRGGMELQNATGGSATIGFLAPSGVTSYDMTFPAAQGATDQVLVNDGTGILSWQNVSSVGGGLLGIGEWEYEDNAGGTPDDESFRFDTANPALATELRIDYENDAGGDLTNILQSLGPGALIYAQEREDSTKGFVATIDDFGTDQGSYILFDLREINLLGTSLSDGEKYAFIIGGVGGPNWNTISTDSGDVSPSDDSATLTLTGGTNVTTSGVDATDTITIDGVNIWNTIAGDSGSTTPNVALDTVTFAGGTDISTSVSGDTVTISFTGTGGTGDVTAAANLVDNSIIRGDGGAKGIQDSDGGGVSWTISDAGVMAGSASLAADTFMMSLTNNTLDGEFINMIGGNGNVSVQLRQNASGDGIIRVYEDATSGTGNSYFEVQDGVMRVGDVANTVDTGIDLLVDNSGGTASGGGSLGWRNNTDDTIRIIAPSGAFTPYTLTLPSDDGSSGDVLTSNGSGVLSWTAAGDVTSGANIVDNSIVRGDGGAKGIQDSEQGTTSYTISDAGKFVGLGDLSGDYVFEITNQNATTGNGMLLKAGETLGDISFSVEDSDGSFIIMECEADQGYVTFGKSYAQTLSDNGVVYGIDAQNGSGSAADINTQSGVYRVAGTPITVGEQVIQKFLFTARSVENPINSDWAVNALAVPSPDSNNAGLLVRLFDDTTEEGVGFTLNIPTGATNMTIRFKSRRETAGATQTVIPNLYRRAIPDNGAVAAWSGALALTALSFPNNEFFQYDEQTITLATLGLTAGETAQFELTRDGTGTLSGDWALLQIEVEFS